MKKNQAWLRRICKIWSSKIFKTMRLSIIIFLIAVNCMWGSETYSQKTKLSLDFQNTEVRAVLDKIEEESEFYFLYSNKLVDVDRKVDIDVKKQKINDILNRLFADTDVTYMVIDRQIVLSRKDYLAESIKKLQQEIEVSGTVTDAQTGEPLPGVNIVVQGTTTGTTTDMDGEYSIEAPDDATLVFSFVGYQEVAVDIGGQQQIDVEMEQAVTELEEVVAVGYSVQRAGDITGSVSSVNTEDIEKVSTPTVSQSLQGKTSGLYIKNVNAQPGEDKTNINIRGFGDPLYIIDGMPVGEREFQRLNSEDIEDISVLKDAAAASVYGARAGNGVILVRTKRGTESAPQFSFKSEGAAQFFVPKAIPEVVNSAQWMELENMVHANEGKDLRWSRKLIENHREHLDGSAPEQYPNTNAYDYTLKDYAPMTNNQLGIRGGTEDVSYFVSGGWIHQRGMLVSDDIGYNKYNLRSNVDIQLAERLKSQVDLNLGMEDYIGPRNQLEGESWGEGQGIMARLRRWRPFYSNAPLPNPDLPRGAPAGQTINPVNAAYIDNVGYRDWTQQRSSIKLAMEYELTEDLNTRVVYNHRREDYRWKEYQKRGPEYQYNEESGEHYVVRYINARARVRQEDELIQENNLQYYLEGDKTFADNHNISGLFVAEYLTDNFDKFDAWRHGYEADIDQLFAGPEDSQYNYSRETEGGRVGYIGRLKYNYADKYNVEFNGRLDGSPKFREEERWGFFPSLSASWFISEETFMENVPWLSMLKLRGSYGRLGNDRALEWQYLETYSFGSPYIYEGSTLDKGLRSDGVPNPHITWEKIDITNLGIDFGFWNNQLRGSLEFFQRDRRDVLGTRIRSLPQAIGADMPQENYQEFQNQGWDLMLNHNNQIGEFNYSLRGNISMTREKTVYTDEVDFANKESERRNTRIGRWSNVVWGYQSDGLFTSQEEINEWADIDGRNNATIQEGDVKYIDRNNDGRITGDDQVILGSGPTPRLNYGLNISLSWKQFDFFMAWQGADLFGFNLAHSEYEWPFASNGAPLMHHLNDAYVPEGNEWRPANTNATWPRLRKDWNPSYNSNLDIWRIDGNYLRLKQVQLTYTLPSNVLPGLDHLNIFVAAYNLLTFSELDFMDPEIDTEPDQFFGNYHPQTGSVNVGIEIEF